MSKFDSTKGAARKAVALKYGANDAAPVVVASGMGYMAEKIVEVAADEGVPIYEDNSLATVLTQLRLAGKFEDCAGIVFGDFKNCEIEFKEYGFTIEEIIRDVAAPSGKPIFTGFQAGHCTPKITLPYGVHCRMNASDCMLEVLEAAVTAR